MDQKAVEAAGFDKGLETGIKQGIKQTAKKLKAKGVDINLIHETTGLSIDEINKL